MMRIGFVGYTCWAPADAARPSSMLAVIRCACAMKIFVILPSSISNRLSTTVSEQWFGAASKAVGNEIQRHFWEYSDTDCRSQPEIAEVMWKPAEVEAASACVFVAPFAAAPMLCRLPSAWYGPSNSDKSHLLADALGFVRVWGSHAQARHVDRGATIHDDL